MPWNYRVVRYADENEVGGSFFLIEEVHYDESGVTPRSHTEGGAGVGSEHIADLWEVLDMMREALNRPPLNDDDWPYEWRGEI